MRRWSKAGWLVALAAILVAGVFYSRTVRRFAVGDDFQYIPRETELVIATGGIEALWTPIHGFFRTAFRSEAMKTFEERLRKAKFPIKRVQDFERYGLDVRRGILIGVYRPSTDLDYIAVLPILSPEKALAGLHALDEQGPKPKSLRIGPHLVHHFEDLFVAFPEADVAVLSSSADLLRRSLMLRSENLRHAANNDALYGAIQRLAHGPLLSGSNVFVYWQGRTAPFDERAAILRLARDEIRIEAEVELRDSTLTAMNALRRRSKGSAGWQDRLPPGTVGMAVLQDEHLGKYRDVFAENVLGGISVDWVETFHRWAPGKNPPRIERLAVAFTDIEDGLPDFLVGLWGERDELEDMLPDLQRELRRTRDTALLNGALRKYRSKRVRAGSPSVADLQELRLLDPEEDSLFHRYPIEQWTVGEPQYRSEDFATPRYEREFRGHRIRYLAPPLGANDRNYREDLENADARSLAGDRYRMATVLDRDVLWIATDVRDLETLLTPKEGLDEERGTPLPPVPDGAKFHLALDVNRLTELSALSPGSPFEKLARDLGLQDFSALKVDVVPSLDETRLRFSASLRQRSAP